MKKFLDRLDYAISDYRFGFLSEFIFFENNETFKQDNSIKTNGSWFSAELVS